MKTRLSQLPQRAARSVRCAAEYHALSHPRCPLRSSIQLRQQQQRFRSSDSNDDQAIPLTGYYADLLGRSPKTVYPVIQTASEPPLADSLPRTAKEEGLEKARVIFGTRLAGPVERRTEVERASHNVAGIMVPPKPEEPDNCCMSGCVNCVWDLFRDELEEWASKSAQARERIAAQRSEGQATGTMLEQPNMPTHVATSMDDDGGGSETNWESGLAMSGREEDLFADVPVGFREFMRTEKMLKEKHQMTKTSSG